MSHKQADDTIDDGECSPECLLTSEPVKDLYSSDEEKDSSRKTQKRSAGHSIVKDTYSSTGNVKIQTLKMYFNLKFCSKPVGPAFETLKVMKIPDIIEKLYYFFTERNDVSADEIIQYVLHHNSGTLIKLLYENKEYAVNLKENDFQESKLSGPTCEEVKCNNLMEDILHALTETLNLYFFATKEHHDIVKSVIYHMGEILSQKLKISGAGILRTEAFAPDSEKETRSSSKSKKPEIFEATADVLLGSLTSNHAPTIPVEVYSPLKKDDKEYAPGSRVKYDKVVSRHSTITDEESDVELNKFLQENAPVFMCQPSPCQQHFKQRVVGQHVLQVISCAVDHIRRTELVKRKRAFLGLFVCNEYVYISKIVSEDQNLRRYEIGFSNKPKESGLFFRSPPDIYVQFSPLILDMSIHNHRMALLFFCKYYLCEWYTIPIDFTIAPLSVYQSEEK